MKLVHTRVFSKIDRAIAAAILLEDARKEKPLLFAMVDNPSHKNSGCERLAKKLSTTFSEGHVLGPGKPRSQARLLTNFTDGYRPLAAGDVELCVMGFGKGIPCAYGWILSLSEPTDRQDFERFFGTDPHRVDQNTYLPGACNVFSFSIWGTLALAVQVLELDRAMGDIAAADPTTPFGGTSWGFLHLWLNDRDRSEVKAILADIEPALENQMLALKAAVKGRTSPAMTSSLAPRVTLSKIAKKHFKKLGYVWNKSESQQRLTVFDKVTERGNVIRIHADSGGHNELIPGINAHFIGKNFKSDRFAICRMDPVSTEDELQALLARHMPDLMFFEANVADLFDRAFGPCPLAMTELIRSGLIRKFEADAEPAE